MNKELICMLIDDDTDDHEIFLLALQNLQPRITCIIEKDARKGLENLNNRSVKPDYVFVDMNMSRMNGKEFIVEMRKIIHLQNMQLVAYSSSTHEKEKLLNLGASFFISKPTTIPMLEQALSSFFTTTPITS